MKTYIKHMGVLAIVYSIVCGHAYAAGAAAELAVPVDYTSSELRDPFETYVPKEEAPLTPSQLQEEVFNPPTLTIQGITWGSNFPQAIVNNKVIKAGDVIEGAEVVRIKSNAIIFRIGTREFTLASPAAGTAGVVNEAK